VRRARYSPPIPQAKQEHLVPGLPWSAQTPTPEAWPGLYPGECLLNPAIMSLAAWRSEGWSARCPVHLGRGGDFVPPLLWTLLLETSWVSLTFWTEMEGSTSVCGQGLQSPDPVVWSLPDATCSGWAHLGYTLAVVMEVWLKC
jgi:hypothetical protein